MGQLGEDDILVLRFFALLSKTTYQRESLFASIVIHAPNDLLGSRRLVGMWNVSAREGSVRLLKNGSDERHQQPPCMAQRGIFRNCRQLGEVRQIESPAARFLGDFEAS